MIIPQICRETSCGLVSWGCCFNLFRQFAASSLQLRERFQHAGMYSGDLPLLYVFSVCDSKRWALKINHSSCVTYVLERTSWHPRIQLSLGEGRVEGTIFDHVGKWCFVLNSSQTLFQVGRSFPR